MYTNQSLNDRVLRLPSTNDPDTSLFKRLVSLIEEYNIIAADKNLPLKSVPIYNSQMNRMIMHRVIETIVKEIERAKSIEIPETADEDAPGDEDA